jgi:hypothetical protein
VQAWAKYLAFFALMIGGGGGLGNEDRGFPCNGQLGQGEGAGTRDDEVGLGMAVAMSSMKALTTTRSARPRARYRS